MVIISKENVCILWNIMYTADVLDIIQKWYIDCNEI